MQILNGTGTGVLSSKRHPMQMFYVNLLQFDLKVKLRNKIQFGSKVSAKSDQSRVSLHMVIKSHPN